MGLINSIKKAAKRALGIDGKAKAKAVKLFGSMGPAGEGMQQAQRAGMQDNRRRRNARGRDSTIITAGSDSYNRTLLG